MLLWLAGCGSKITQENFDKIQVGMGQDEVTTILGKPTESSSVSFGSLP
jgi:outer membrane protein assembly factor BamE (lipoprotein component of BamABCDE complex)